MEFLLKKSQEIGLDWVMSTYNNKPALYSKKHNCYLRESSFSSQDGGGWIYKINVNGTKVVLPESDFAKYDDWYRSLFVAVAVIAKTLNDLKT